MPERRLGQSLGAEAKGFCNSLIKCRFSSYADVNTQEVRAGQATPRRATGASTRVDQEAEGARRKCGQESVLWSLWGRIGQFK